MVQFFQILRIINHYLKTHAHNINVEIVEVLLALNLKDVNLDFEKEQNIKDKKLKANKQKILQMSKKERKVTSNNCLLIRFYH